MIQKFDSIDDLVLSCINKTRAMTSPELWERVQRACRKNDTLPLPQQVKHAVKRILAAGKATYNPQNKTIIRA